MLAESGVGWVPYFLSRMDLEWQELGDKLDYAPKISPSELFRRQVIVTFEQEPLAAQLIPMLGADVVHVGIRLPAHRQHVPGVAAMRSSDTLGALSDADIRKIARDELRATVRFHA